MSFKYYFLDNGRYHNTTNRGRVYFPARIIHYAETLPEAVDEARKVTCGKRIEICPRYGLSNPVAVVEPDGTVIRGTELAEHLRRQAAASNNE